MTDTTTERAIRTERVFKASVERVFDAWTTVAGLKAWFGPGNFTVPELEMDAHQGGQWKCVMRSPDGDLHTVAGVLERFERPSHLVMTWAWVQPDGSRGHETTIDVRFEGRGDETLMRFEHRGFQDDEACERHEQGWDGTWPKLQPALNNEG